MTQPENTSTKKTYNTPTLTAYGDIRTITQTIARLDGKADDSSGRAKT